MTTNKPGDPVRQIMVDRIAAVEAGASLLEVARELAAADIGAVLVASPGAPAGVISERDVVAVVAQGVGGNGVRDGGVGEGPAIQAGEIMTGDLVVARPQDSIESVGRLMLDAGVRHVPIREGDTLVGLVSMRDVLSVLLAAHVTE